MATLLGEFSDLLRDRLTADTGSGGLFNVGAPLLNAPICNQFQTPALDSTSAFPFITFEIESLTNEPEGFGLASIEFGVNLIVTMSMDGSDPMDTWFKVFDRVYGDWLAQYGAGNPPTYGLHRWEGGDVATLGWHVGLFEMDTADNITSTGNPGTYQWLIRFKVLVTKNPA